MRRSQQQKTCLADKLFGTDVVGRIAGIGVTIGGHRFDGQRSNVQSEAEAADQIRLVPSLRSNYAL